MVSTARHGRRCMVGRSSGGSAWGRYVFAACALEASYLSYVAISPCKAEPISTASISQLVHNSTGHLMEKRETGKSIFAVTY